MDPTQRRRGVLTQHRDRMANDPEYRESALTAPSITDKTGVSAKVLPRTTPTALSGSAPVDLERLTAEQIAELKGQGLDEALQAAGIDASSGGSRADGGMTADEKRAALRAYHTR